MKILRATCLLVLCVMLISPASASLNDSSATEHSREEFLSRLMEIKAIGLCEAEAVVATLEDSAGQQGQYSYWEFKSLHDYGNNHVIEAGVLCLTKGSGADRSFCGDVVKWTRATGDGNYEWTEAYHVVVSTPTQLTQMVRGRVAVSSSTRSLGGIWSRMRLRRAGFPQGMVLGGIWYSAKMKSWTDTLEADSLDGVKSGGN